MKFTQQTFLVLAVSCLLQQQASLKLPTINENYKRADDSSKLAGLLLANNVGSVELQEIDELSASLTEGDILPRNQPNIFLRHDAAELEDYDGQFSNLPHGVNLWPNGTVPYEVQTELASSKKRMAMIWRAVGLLSRYTCVEFVPRTAGDGDYVYFMDGGLARCFSYLGRVGGRQEVSVGFGCERQVGVVLHELLHALGLTHEQSRADRDAHVTIVWRHIDNTKRRNFLKYTEEDLAYQPLLPYDYASVMHYHSRAFTINGRRTIITNNQRAQKIIGQRVGLSACDVARINHLYGCVEQLNNEASFACDRTDATTSSPRATTTTRRTTTTAPAPLPLCFDVHEEICAAALFQPHFCDLYPGIYRQLCRRTCNRCSGPVCVDSPYKPDMCASLSWRKELCELEPTVGFMCPRSCALCIPEEKLGSDQTLARQFVSWMKFSTGL